MGKLCGHALTSQVNINKTTGIGNVAGQMDIAIAASLEASIPMKNTKARSFTTNI